MDEPHAREALVARLCENAGIDVQFAPFFPGLLRPGRDEERCHRGDLHDVQDSIDATTVGSMVIAAVSWAIAPCAASPLPRYEAQYE